MKLNLVDILIKYKILSFYIASYAYKTCWINEEEIEEYSVFVVDKLKLENSDIISLCSAKFMERDSILDLLDKLAKEYKVCDNEEEKLVLVSLIALDRTYQDEETKLNKLQELYASLNYPGIMEYCSIYRIGERSAIEEMKYLIKYLSNKLGLFL